MVSFCNRRSFLLADGKLLVVNLILSTYKLTFHHVLANQYPRVLEGLLLIQYAWTEGSEAASHTGPCGWNEPYSAIQNHTLALIFAHRHQLRLTAFLQHLS